MAMSRRPFWSIMKRHVHIHGPLRPFHVFPHALQAVYSRIKGGVDATDQFRAVMNYSGINVTLEQKLMLFFLKRQVVNSFISWCLLQCDTFVQDADTLFHLNSFSCREHSHSQTSSGTSPRHFSRTKKTFNPRLHRSAEASSGLRPILVKSLSSSATECCLSTLRRG